MTAHPSAFARALAALALLVLSATPPAAAASKEIERLQVQVAGLQGQLVSLQRAVEDTAREMKRLSELVAEQNATTRRGVQEQRGSNEALQASLKEVVERLGEISEQLQASRLQAPPVLSDGSPSGGGAPQPGLANAPAPRELYSQAYADFARGNYDIAIQGFQEYLKNYPDTDFADNAQYWVGECLYGKQKFDDAIEAWKALIRDYASSDKLPDARVKMGMALEKLGRRSQALLEYRFVVEHYPNSPAARIARDKLNP